MIFTVLHLKTAPQRTADMVQALRSVMRPARAEKGFIACELSLDANDAHSLRYEERWQTQQEFEAQVRSPRYTRLLTLMESASEQPSLELHFVSKTRSLDYIAEVREIK